MSKNSNKLQLSNDLKNRYYVAKSKGLCSQSNSGEVLKHSNTIPCDEIAKECNKPLHSISWVSTKNKPRMEWKYNSDKHFGVYRAIGNLWLCRDRQVKELSDCEKEQIKLYNRLKREYELEQKLLKDKQVMESTVTVEDKARAKARRTAYFLNKDNYDMLYGIKNCIR